MLKNDDEDYKKMVMDNIYYIFSQDLLPLNHQAFLERLSCDKRCDVKVIYDIGSCVMHWYTHARRIWKNADIICFDAFELVGWLQINFTLFTAVYNLYIIMYISILMTIDRSKSKTISLSII